MHLLPVHVSQCMLHLLQVLDMAKKENGRYARFATASLTAMRYQVRIGVLAAGDYGVPQVSVCAGVGVCSWGCECVRTCE